MGVTMRMGSYMLFDSFYMIRDKILNLPHEIKIELTYVCNKNCEFCFNNNILSENKSISELDTINLKDLLIRMKSRGIKRVRFTGGEPLMRKDLIDLLKFSKSNGFIIKLNTNADMLTSENIRQISHYCDEILFSLHDTNIHQIKQLANKIKYAKKQGCVTKISTVATMSNIKKFETFLNIIKDIEPAFWYWNYPIPIKRELITWNDILLLGKCIKNNKLRKTKVMGIRFPLCNIDTSLKKQITGCKNCGPYDHLVVNPKGEIHLCNSFNVNLGSSNDDIVDIWRNHPLIKEFKNHSILPEDCRTCEKLEDCYGGCRYSAYLHSGKIEASKHPLMER